jgi:hypothetical protein
MREGGGVTAHQWAIFQTYYVEGRTFRETWKRVGISSASLCNHLRAIRAETNVAPRPRGGTAMVARVEAQRA